MALDLTKPTMLDVNWAAALGYIRENFRALVQDAISFTGYLVSAVGFKERGRSTPIGEWTAFTPTITPSAGAWGSAVYTAKYMLIGKTLWLNFTMSGNLTGAAATLLLTIPGGFTTAANWIVPTRSFDGTTWALGVAYSNTSAGTITFANGLGAGTYPIATGIISAVLVPFEIQ